jgi:replicative DNA helicase
VELTNIASERIVLAGICTYGLDCYLDVEPFLEENTFTVDYNKVLYKCLQGIVHKHKPDFVSIISAATDISLGEFVQKPDVLKHIQGVLNTPVQIESISGHAKKIRKLQCARHLQSVIKTTYKELESVTGEESLTEIIGIVDTAIQKASMSFLKKDENKPKLLGEGGKDYFDYLVSDEIKQIGIPTPFPAYNEAIGGGLLRKAVDLVGARTKAGKSIFCDNVALYVTDKLNIPVLVLDTEMSEMDHWNRVWANMSGVTINEIKRGTFKTDPAKTAAVAAARDRLAEIPYHYINVSGKDFDDILAIARRWILKEVGFDQNGRTKDCLIIYDYFKLMSADGLNDMQEFQALGFQATKLHNFTVEHDCSCLSFVQLNRSGIDKETSDVISQSDRIGWLCTSFTILKEKSAEERADDGPRNGNRKLVPVLSRHGAGCEGYICLEMTGELARMREIGLVDVQRRDFPERPPGEIEDEDSSDPPPFRPRNEG